MSSYFDIDNIISEEETLPCNFLLDAEDLGYLDAGPVGSNIESGSNVDISMWLVKPLVENDFVEVEEPESYGKHRINDLVADPTVVSFQNSPYYYTVGRTLAELTSNEELLQLLLESFNVRFLNIADKAYNWRDEDSSIFTQRLCLTEKHLFTLGNKTSTNFYRWKNRYLDKITSTRRSTSRWKLLGKSNGSSTSNTTGRKRQRDH